MSISKKQIGKSVLYVSVAAALGGIWIAIGPWPASCIVAGLCVLAGFGLSLPGVSAARVAGGTIGLIAAKNAPRCMREKIMDACLGENPSPKTDPANSEEPKER